MSPSPSLTTIVSGITAMTDYAAKQSQLRARLFARHQAALDTWWNEDGSYVGTPDLSIRGGAFRASLWHTLAYLAGDARCVERANRIILSAYTQTPCHFSPGAALDVLLGHRAALSPEAATALERYLVLTLPYMSTDDLQLYGYNDNHPFKAMHALILGGELLGRPDYVELGLCRLRQAVTLLSRNGFPCEYNSPNYTPVSLNPLAGIAEHAQSAEARDLALRLERFYWQDLALHWDARCGLAAGPWSRSVANDCSGLIGCDLWLLSYLFPERFDFDLCEEYYDRGTASVLAGERVSPMDLFFKQAHLIWDGYATFHLDPSIEAMIFEKPAGVCVQGTAETGIAAIGWANAADRPLNAPRRHIVGPRRALLTTWHGDGFTLGTAQGSWLTNEQAHGFIATLDKGPKVRPQDAAVYFSAMFFDEEYPFGDKPPAKPTYLSEKGDIRTVQHEGSAMVLYNPMPVKGTCSRIRTGIFRSLLFNRPRALYVGERAVPDLNVSCDHLAPIALDEGDHFVGFIPLRLTDHGQSHNEVLRIHTYSSHLAILVSSFSSWGANSFDYEDLVATNSGFVCEVAPATAFASFAAFRTWLAAASVDDRWYSDMRTTTYSRDDLSLSACYSPFTNGFRHATVNNVAVAYDPPLRVTGMEFQPVDLLSPS